MPNVYLIADSNHGFKMTAIGKLVAQHVVTGDDIQELKPFAFNRFENYAAFGSGITHSPWV